MELLQRLFYTSLGAASLFYFIVKISLSHWKKRGILHEKPKFLWGNLKGVGQKRHLNTALRELYEKYKGRTEAPFIGCYAYLKPMLLILDLDLIRHILDKDAQEYFSARGLYHNESGDPLSGNLLQLDGEKWQELHNKLAPIFAAEQLEALLPALLQVAEAFERTSRSSAEIRDVTQLVDDFNVKVIAAMAFGLDEDEGNFEISEFRDMTHNYLNNFSLLRAYLSLHYPNVARLLQCRSFDVVASAYFRQLVSDQLKWREWNRKSSSNADFLKSFAALRRLRQPETHLPKSQIAPQSFTFVLAGLEACNGTLSFCLFELSLQPEVQQKTRDEIEAVLRRHKGQLNVRSLKEMQYLKQVIYETLRKHSPYPCLLRNTTKDYEVPNSVFMLQQDNHLIIPTSAIHHDAEIYPQPEQFDPDRFEPVAMQRRHPMSWLPFGVGPRSCIARHFAEMQIQVGLVTLLRHYKFSICSETALPLAYDNSKLILAPKEGIKLLVEPV